MIFPLESGRTLSGWSLAPLTANGKRRMKALALYALVWLLIFLAEFTAKSSDWGCSLVQLYYWKKQDQDTLHTECLKAMVTVVTNMHDSDFISVQVEALPISVWGCPVHVPAPPAEQWGLCALAGAVGCREGLSRIALEWWRVCLSSKNWNDTFRWVWSPNPQRRDLRKHLRGSGLNQTIP